MNAIAKISAGNRYERTIETSKRVRWDIDKDVIRARRFDTTHKFLPDGLSLVGLPPKEWRAFLIGFLRIRGA